MLSNIVYLILSFGLTGEFLRRFIELSNELFPNTSVITIGTSSLPSYLKWLIPLNELLSSRIAVLIMLILTFIAFIFAIYEIINKIKKQRA